MIAPKASCTVTMTFSPSQAGLQQATLQQSSNSVGYGNQSVALSGVGQIANGPALTLSSTSLVYTPQVVGTTSAYQSVTATSTGTAPVNILAVSVTGDFILYSNGCPTTSNYPPGASCPIYIQFIPSAAGTRTGTLTIIDNATGSPHTVSLSGQGLTSAPSDVVSPSSLVFLGQLLGTQSSAQSFTITNTGNAPVTVYRVQDTPEFPSSLYCPTIQQAGGYCTISVAFAPAAAGTRTATLLIFDNTPGSPHSVSVSGTGVTPATAIAPTATSLAFGPQVVGTTSTAQLIYFANTGNISVKVTSVVPAGDFALQTDSCTSVNIAVGSSCYIYVNFTPTAAGTRTGSLTFTATDSGSPHVISLTGTGVAVATSLVPSVTAIAYGPQTVGTTSALQQIIYFTNNGDLPVTVNAVTASGDFAVPAGYDACTGANIAVGSSCYIYVVFMPTTAGTRTGSIALTSSDSGSPYVISLTGQGVAVLTSLIPSVTGLAFGPQPIGTTNSSQQIITFTNDGDLPVSVTSVAPSGDFAVSSDGCTNVSVAVGSTCSFYVTFTPRAPWRALAPARSL